ncbi:MAG: Ppx/GppA phosphatase [Deltaproteobacteria bacterium]|nr:Ppx/GppA phosphatase [Deltaproteobacteria bacterium]
MRSAVIDLGSNTFHLLVADVDQFGIRRVLGDHKIAVRIGEQAFAQGLIPDDAYARGLAALDELRARSQGHPLRVVATGVFRETANASQFLADAGERSGLAIELLDTWEEARLTWTGVSAELAGSHGKLAVIDLGGGSLECALGTSSMDRAHGLPLGVLRLRELAPEAVRRAVFDALADPIRELRAANPDTVALSSGTARALFRLGRRLGLVAEGQRHVWRRTLGDLARMLAPLRGDALACLGVAPARLDTIATGAIVLHTALELLNRPVAYVARSALREGAMIDLVQQQAASIDQDAGSHARYDATAWKRKSINGR